MTSTKADKPSRSPAYFYYLYSVSEQLVSDNGPQFGMSSEFESLMSIHVVMV